jgi:hypothetical protein
MTAALRSAAKSNNRCLDLAMAGTLRLPAPRIAGVHRIHTGRSPNRPSTRRYGEIVLDDDFFRPDDRVAADPEEQLAGDSALEYEFVVDDEDEPGPAGALGLTPPD